MAYTGRLPNSSPFVGCTWIPPERVTRNPPVTVTAARFVTVLVACSGPPIAHKLPSAYTTPFEIVTVVFPPRVAMGASVVMPPAPMPILSPSAITVPPSMRISPPLVESGFLFDVCRAPPPPMAALTIGAAFVDVA